MCAGGAGPGRIGPGQSRKAQELINDLKDKSPKVRVSAADDLGRLAGVKISDARTALPALRRRQGSRPSRAPVRPGRHRPD